MKKSNKVFLSTRGKILTILIFIVTLIVIASPLFFREHFKNFTSLGLIGLFLINFFGSATIFLPAPAILSIPVFGTLYNPFIVALFSASGSSLGEATSYLFGYSSKEVLKIKKHKLLFHLLEFLFKKYGSITVFVLSLIPNPIIDILGIIAGLSNYPVKKFLLFVFAGRIIRDILIASSPNLLR